MSDYIVRATAANSQIRAFAAVTTDMVETARKDHNTSPVATAALGRLLTGGAMMGAMMKGEKDLLTLRIHAGGPLQGITVTADSHGNVKGYVGNSGKQQRQTGCCGSCRCRVYGCDQGYGLERAICGSGCTSDQ